MSTPEGRIKRKVNARLAQYPGLWKFMPVQRGMGMPALDYLLCVGGEFIALETKAPGCVPTDRQRGTIRCIERAGGHVFIIDSDESLDRAMQYICETYTEFDRKRGAGH